MMFQWRLSIAYTSMAKANIVKDKGATNMKVWSAEFLHTIEKEEA